MRAPEREKCSGSTCTGCWVVVALRLAVCMCEPWWTGARDVVQSICQAPSHVELTPEFGILNLKNRHPYRHTTCQICILLALLVPGPVCPRVLQNFLRLHIHLALLVLAVHTHHSAEAARLGCGCRTGVPPHLSPIIVRYSTRLFGIVGCV